VNKYERVPDEIIDLHGYTRHEAEEFLRVLFRERRGQHIRLITGKALFRDKGPVLKNFVTDFLTARKTKFAQAKLANGGEGALEVYL